MGNTRLNSTLDGRPTMDGGPASRLSCGRWEIWVLCVRLTYQCDENELASQHTTRLDETSNTHGEPLGGNASLKKCPMTAICNLCGSVSNVWTRSGNATPIAKAINKATWYFAIEGHAIIIILKKRPRCSLPAPVTRAWYRNYRYVCR